MAAKAAVRTDKANKKLTPLPVDADKIWMSYLTASESWLLSRIYPNEPINVDRKLGIQKVLEELAANEGGYIGLEYIAVREPQYTNTKKINWDKVLARAARAGRTGAIVACSRKNITAWDNAAIEAAGRGHMDALYCMGALGGRGNRKRLATSPRRSEKARTPKSG
jgi:hypothetical protein